MKRFGVLTKYYSSNKFSVYAVFSAVAFSFVLLAGFDEPKSPPFSWTIRNVMAKKQPGCILFQDTPGWIFLFPRQNAIANDSLVV